MTTLRRLFVTCLALILIWVSAASAAARFDLAGAQEVILCRTAGAGQGAETLLLDATGKPVTARACPHCLAAASPAAALPPAAPTLALRLDRAALWQPVAAPEAAPPLAPRLSPLSRAPPQAPVSTLSNL